MAKKKKIRNKIPLMIDSGAYSAFTRGEPIDLQRYIEYLHRVIPLFDSVEYVNLDVIGGDGSDSYENWQEMRRQGLNPVPVYHVITDVKWLKKYLRETDHISIGAVAATAYKRRTWSLDRVWEEFLVGSDRMPLFRVHGMGATSFRIMRRYPWHSVDSTSWLQPSAYGKLFLPKRTADGWDYTGQPNAVFVSEKSGRRGDKNEHLANWPKEKQQVVFQYLEEVGMPLGESKIVDGEEEVVIPGVRNDYWMRCQLNAMFFGRAFKAIEWPRPFSTQRPSGFFGASAEKRGRSPKDIDGTPVIYFSGDIPIENFLGWTKSVVGGVGIMLSYYQLAKGDGLRAHQRLLALAEGREYEAPKSKFLAAVV